MTHHSHYALLLFLLLASCSNDQEVEVIDVRDHPTCIGSDQQSLIEIVETKERRQVCGYYGKVGERFVLRIGP